MDVKTLPLQLKRAANDGTFSGYAAYYGNVDLGGDVIEPGAFKEFATNAKGRLRLFYQHDINRPMGTAAFSDDGKGLLVDAKLNTQVSYVKDAYALMQDGTLDQMSIGYDILDNGFEKKGEVYHLKALKLWEASVVSFAMNPMAEVFDVKRFESKRGFEGFLRDAGFPKARAIELASRYYRESDSPEGKAMSESLSGIQARAQLNLLRLAQ